MQTKRISSGALWGIALVAAAGLGWAWYNNLDLRQKQFIQNILRQVPYLPTRYTV